MFGKLGDMMPEMPEIPKMPNMPGVLPFHKKTSCLMNRTPDIGIPGNTPREVSSIPPPPSLHQTIVTLISITVLRTALCIRDNPGMYGVTNMALRWWKKVTTLHGTLPHSTPPSTQHTTQLHIYVTLMPDNSLTNRSYAR